MPAIDAIENVSPDCLAKFDDIIDVRSPREFDEDHIPSAINLPVLNDEERATIGTTYVQGSRFHARRHGAAHVTRNISAHLERALADKPARYRPLIYCWRGGMRSGAMATILAAIGWRVSVLKDGYRAWRRNVVCGLRENSTPFNVILVDGQTGTAKTALLNKMAELGLQTLDLEGAANHRGSVFGGIANQTQPSQKMFESRIWHRLANFDLDQPIFVEAESSLIGRRSIPSRLLQSMRIARRIEIVAAPDIRAEYLVETYRELLESDVGLQCAIGRLKPFHTKATIESWLSMAKERNFVDLARALTEQHYDPLYNRQRKRRCDKPIELITLADLTGETLHRTAVDIKNSIHAKPATASEARSA